MTLQSNFSWKPHSSSSQFETGGLNLERFSPAATLEWRWPFIQRAAFLQPSQSSETAYRENNVLKNRINYHHNLSADAQTHQFLFWENYKRVCFSGRCPCLWLRETLKSNSGKEKEKISIFGKFLKAFRHRFSRSSENNVVPINKSLVIIKFDFLAIKSQHVEKQCAVWISEPGWFPWALEPHWCPKTFTNPSVGHVPL